MNYTPQQRAAIECIDSNLQIIACAGSGKTRVVAQRIVRVLASRVDQGITPGNVVAFTFTDKAAAELKERITRYYEERFSNIEGLAAMYVGTIHGFCLDLLQRYDTEYLKYDILDEVQQRLFIDRYHQQCGMASLGLKRWVESSVFIRLLGVLRESSPDPKAKGLKVAREALETYQSLLEEHRYLDYDEVLVQAVALLLSRPDVRERVAERIKYLTVDEYQDVNPIQEALIRTLHDLGANLCVVGDDDQNIYQWRGSDVSTILTFAERYPNVDQITLAENFRSTDSVVKSARACIEHNEKRLPKAMSSSRKRPAERGDLVCLAFDTPEEEATWIADKVLAMRGVPYTEDDGRTRGLSWSDCAVLLRSVRHCARPIVDALRDRGIPHLVTGMTGLFDTPEAQAAVAVFQYMDHEIEEADLAAAWSSADLGLTKKNLAAGVTLLSGLRSFDPGKRFSTYNLQRAYLGFLEAIELREERVRGGRGEVVFYNLGKFSQVISDFEQIHFKSKPESKYHDFVQFLRYQAAGYYPEGGLDAAYAVPDAVRIMTVHQAKGTEFPVVFLPALQKNRFPSKKQGNRVWSLIPKTAIENADRYDGTTEDERRLFYVALTRSEKYLFCSWAPLAENQLYRKPGQFWEELTHQEQFLTKEPKPKAVKRLDPEPRRPMVDVELSFSELKYYFLCPYQFKLRFLYGFNASLDEAMGYGRSLHNALAEVHRRALDGDIVDDDAVPDLLGRHLHLRYAYPKLEESLRGSAEEAVARYLREHRPQLSRLVYAEEDVQVNLEDGIVVHGRIDLIKRTDNDEVTIVDFKSDSRAQEEDVTRAQLHVYALGYEQRFGESADLLEIHNLDEGGSTRELVDDDLVAGTRKTIVDAGGALRENRLERLGSHCESCTACDFVGICRGAKSPSVQAAARARGTRGRRT